MLRVFCTNFTDTANTLSFVIRFSTTFLRALFVFELLIFILNLFDSFQLICSYTMYVFIFLPIFIFLK